VFIQFNVCQCAEEKQPVRTDKIALTRLVRKAGCASKIGQADLLRVLGNLPLVADPNGLLGTTAGDDAGVYQIDDGRALVQTVDVFTPCVDDPYLFGQIAAANSLSDVYAMGGKPITALSIIGFPIDTLDGAIMESMLRGGIDKLEEAGCALIGGHSINDDEIKFGFAVTGLIDAGAVVPRDMARPGDVLVLTKPLGTGMIAFAAQLGLVSEACIEETGQWMATLNKDAAELMVQYGAHACTDITGFALAGHLVEMVRKSGVDAEIDLSAIPVRKRRNALEGKISSAESTNTRHSWRTLIARDPSFWKSVSATTWVSRKLPARPPTRCRRQPCTPRRTCRNAWTGWPCAESFWPSMEATTFSTNGMLDCWLR
jgi:selenide,water dikinase